MSWFGDQIKQRKQFDDENFQDAFLDVASAILGRKISDYLKQKESAKDATREILKYYHFSFTDNQEKPNNIKSFEEELNYYVKPYGIMYRNVILDENWYEQAIGPMIAFTKENNVPVALIPGKIKGYYFKDDVTNRNISITKRTSKLFNNEAYYFYRPLPQKKLTIADLLKFMVSLLSTSDIIRYFVMMA